ncbi:MAG: DUF4175 family protein [Bacteroidales bacterium]
MKDNYDILIRKLDEFIRKYYKNQLIKGAIYSIAALVIFFLITNALEYFGNFTPVFRTILFYLYLLGNLVILITLIIIPLARLYRIGPVISHEQAAVIIGHHFPGVQDRLLNTLQLKQMQDFNPEHTDLIEASIDQKINHLKPVPFQTAIDLKQNRKYLRYALPPLIILIIILFAAPSFITEPTNRLIHHTTYYEKPAPFRIVILNSSLQAAQQEDFDLEVKLEGSEIPDNLMIEYNNSRFKLLKKNNILYHYPFKNLQKNIVFQILTEDYTSKEYELVVLPKPIVLNFEVELSYPNYLHKENEKLINNGDILVPFGTVVTWKFYTRDTREILLRFKDKTQKLEQKGSNAFQYTGVFLESQVYSITSFNEYLKNKDSLLFNINVIPDSYPLVNAEEYRDSVYEKRLYFKGDIKDDYGFSRMTFNYSLIKSGDSVAAGARISSDTVGINLHVNQQGFYHFFDLSTLNINAGQSVEYYFEVWDNDGINGPKSSRSQKMFFKAPTLQEINEKSDKANKELKDEMAQALKDARDLQKQVEELNKKLLDKKEIGWQEKKQIQDLLKKQEQLQEKVEDIQQQQSENSIRDLQNREMSEELIRKQEELQDLFNQIIPDEMKKMIEEMQKMMENLDKNKLNDMLDKIEMNSEDLEKQLDRNLEIFKQLEFETKLEQTKQRLDSLAKKQEKLSEESQKKDADTKEQLEKQEELNKEFEEFTKDMEDLEKKNEELENPNAIPDTKEDQENIKNEMGKSSENLKEKKGNKASQNQKKAAQKMKELGNKMEQMQQQMQGEELEEDIKSLREILENLVQISFDQEDLMQRVNKVRTYDPQFLKMVQEQKKLKDDLKMVEDSLFALSKRQASIKPIINREISEINMNVEKTMEELTERRTNNAAGKQQLVMTGINNLALLLQESLNQMQNMQQQGQGSGKSSCKKNGKGSGNMPIKSMKELQDALNKQMEGLKDAMNKPGQKKPGQGSQSMSEQLARMAAQQEAIRKELQKMRDEIAKDGKGNAGNLNKIIQDMEQTETDLVNKMITNQTLMRQKEILSRLLESEKALREREKEERRESTEAKNQLYSNPKNFFEYNKIKSKETELLKTMPPTLKPFYKNKVSAYFYNFEE